MKAKSRNAKGEIVNAESEKRRDEYTITTSVIAQALKVVCIIVTTPLTI